jgi:hypothetical protein
MFENSPFNGDISSWDVSNVEYAISMFLDNTAFNQDLSSWQFSSLINGQSMFLGASSFDQNLCSWTTTMNPSANVLGASLMFQGTQCPEQGYPVSVTDGPFCYPCPYCRTISTIMTD